MPQSMQSSVGIHYRSKFYLFLNCGIVGCWNGCIADLIGKVDNSRKIDTVLTFELGLTLGSQLTLIS